jgi:RNA polymerase sigma factor (sigma-70 family)
MTNTGSEPFVKNLLRVALRHDGTGMTDGQLLEAFIAKHDAAAFEALVHRHGSMVWCVCHRILRNAHDADDAFQATFLVLARKAASVVPREMIGNWLHGVAHMTAIRAKAVAAKQRARERQVIAMPEPLPQDEDLSPDLIALLDQELKSLPDRLRVAIVLCDLEGRTRAEVARQLKIPEGTLSSRLTTGRRMLAKKLARHGVFPAAALATILSQNGGSACVSAALVGSTVKAATLVAAGQAITPAIASAKVVLLSEGVMKAMLLTRLKAVLAAVLVAVAALTGIASTGTWPASSGVHAADKAPAGAHTASAAPSGTHSVYAAVPLDDRPKADPIDDDTIAAYEKLGAVYGGLRMAPGGIVFEHGEEAAARYLPGFRFLSLPKGELPRRLPAVGVQFGLDFTLTHLKDAGLKELKDLKNLTLLDLYDTQVTDAGLKELKELKNLTSLNLRFSKVTDAGLKELKDLKNLTSLVFGPTEVTEEGLKALKDLKNLTWLELSFTKVTGAGLKELKELKNLTSLDLSNTVQVTEEELKELKELKNLTSLNLGCTDMREEGLKELKELKNLTWLDLSLAKVTDAGLKHLKELKNLTSLNLHSTKVTDEGLKELKELKNLTSLDLSNTQVTGEGVKELKELKNLTSLNLHSTKVTDEGLKELKELKNLTTLGLGATQVTDAGLKELKEFKNLTWLDLLGTRMTAAGRDELKKALPKCKGWF